MVGNYDALENAAVNVDMPRSPGILDEETLFLQSIVLTYGREHPLGVVPVFLQVHQMDRRRQC